MKKDQALFFVILVGLYIVRSQRHFIDQDDSRNDQEIDEKVYFPGKTNNDEVNLKRLANSLASIILHEKESNRIEDDDENEKQIHSTTNHINIVIINADGGKKPFSRQPDLNTNNGNISPSFTKRIINSVRDSSKERDSNEKDDKLVSSNRRNTNQATPRIPPPSLISSASGSSTLRICEIKYAEYIQRIFPQETGTASDANDKEFNGRVLAAPGQYPHMTALGLRASNGKTDYKCGGSLISETFVITAAHCTNFTGLQPNKVRIGDLNLMVEENYLEPQIRNIKKIYVHPDYKRTSYYHDIALLELDKEVELTEFVRPIRLWTQETLPFTMAYAMGYGATEFARERTNRLTNLNMTIVPNDECNREIPKLPEAERGILSSQICARDYVLNRDTCQGDSGGPLQFNIRGRKNTDRLHYQLIGITSYGLYCRSGRPSIFTRVCSYLDWIEPIVWRDYFN